MMKLKAKDLTVSQLAKYIDYSVLKPEFTLEEIENLSKDGVKLGCATICINSAYVPYCEPFIAGSETTLCPVVDFPFGTSSTASRVKQIEDVSAYDSVKEIDIVVNFGLVRSEAYDEIKIDLQACVDVAHKNQKELKVIFETDALEESHIRKLCQICVEVGVDFVKTSTGFLTGHDNNGATVEVIKIMIEEVAGKCKIKGSGAIRTREHFLELIDLGIDRMGVGYRSVSTVLGLDQ